MFDIEEGVEAEIDALEVNDDEGRDPYRPPRFLRTKLRLALERYAFLDPIWPFIDRPPLVLDLFYMALYVKFTPPILVNMFFWLIFACVSVTIILQCTVDRNIDTTFVINTYIFMQVIITLIKHIFP